MGGNRQLAAVRERTAAKRSAQCPAVPDEAGGVPAAVLAGAGAGVLAGAAGVMAVVEEVGAAAGGVAAVDD
jgi:hypothetical protein